jgi:beta-lactamase superfamily II metal-dependent hydrolase
MEIKVLSSRECVDLESNNGDCFIIDNGEEIIVYDCGCEEYANWIIKYMDDHGYSKAKIVLSHNDDDHFKGIPYLIDKNRVEEITTVLLLRYVNELLDLIDDGRKNRESLKKQIQEKYDNIRNLSGCNLQDAFVHKQIANGIVITGPGKEYILNAAAKGLDTREGDTIDGETITNATSIHLSVELNGKKMLLTGDSSFESVDLEELDDYKFIQLPHHGKNEIASQIFEKLRSTVDEVYIVSDNTGNSNGGSDKLESKGYQVRNTKNDGMLTFNYNTIIHNKDRVGSLSEISNCKR